MSPAELLADLHSQGISPTVNGDKLRCKGKESTLTPELLETLRERKSELIFLLKGMCICEPPMPPAGIESPACRQCGIACWCSTCRGCRWCAFSLKWRGQIESKYRK